MVDLTSLSECGKGVLRIAHLTTRRAWVVYPPEVMVKMARWMQSKSSQVQLPRRLAFIFMTNKCPGQSCNITKHCSEARIKYSTELEILALARCWKAYDPSSSIDKRFKRFAKHTATIVWAFLLGKSEFRKYGDHRQVHLSVHVLDVGSWKSHFRS
jgi:hypothetical protein